MATADNIIVAPRELIIPTLSGARTAQPTMSGALFISGGKLFFALGASQEKITSV